MDKIYIFMQCAPDPYEYFQSIFDLKAEQLHFVECAHNDFMHEPALHYTSQYRRIPVSKRMTSSSRMHLDALLGSRL